MCMHHKWRVKPLVIVLIRALAVHVIHMQMRNYFKHRLNQRELREFYRLTCQQQIHEQLSGTNDREIC